MGYIDITSRLTSAYVFYLRVMAAMLIMIFSKEYLTIPIIYQPEWDWLHGQEGKLRKLF
jgi:hypothetical protein